MVLRGFSGGPRPSRSCAQRSPSGRAEYDRAQCLRRCAATPISVTRSSYASHHAAPDERAAQVLVYRLSATALDQHSFAAIIEIATLGPHCNRRNRICMHAGRRPVRHVAAQSLAEPSTGQRYAQFHHTSEWADLDHGGSGPRPDDCIRAGLVHESRGGGGAYRRRHRCTRPVTGALWAPDRRDSQQTATRGRAATGSRLARRAACRNCAGQRQSEPGGRANRRDDRQP